MVNDESALEAISLISLWVLLACVVDDELMKKKGFSYIEGKWSVMTVGRDPRVVVMIELRVRACGGLMFYPLGQCEHEDIPSTSARHRVIIFFLFTVSNKFCLLLKS